MLMCSSYVYLFLSVFAINTKRNYSAHCLCFCAESRLEKLCLIYLIYRKVSLMSAHCNRSKDLQKLSKRSSVRVSPSGITVSASLWAK